MNNRNWQRGVLLHPQLLKTDCPLEVGAHLNLEDVPPGGLQSPALGALHPVKTKSFWETSKSLWKTYCRYSTIHGIRIAAADDASHFMRLFWACALIGATVIATYICHNFFEKARKFPTTIRVADDHLELYNVVFPAIAICPTNRVRMSVARDYILMELAKSKQASASAILRTSNVSLEREIHSFVTAMSHFELQSVQASERPFSRAQKLLAALVDMNVTDFMIQTFPKCEELMSKCEWHGLPMNCCQDFLLQQSPIGYCYSFNSLSAMGKKFCKIPEDFTIQRTARSSFSADGPECLLRRTTGFGVGSGLRIKIKNLKKEYTVKGVEELLMVAIYSPVRYPKAGSFGRIRPNWNQNLLVAVTLENTAMSEDVGLMDYTVSQCIGEVIPDNLQPRTLNVYTYSTCKLECRLEYMKEKCGCYPYFFGGEPQCNTADLIRCIRTCRQIHWQIPPEKPEIEANFGNLDESGINCTQCYHRCQTLVYYPDISARYTKSRSGIIDVFYRDLTAAKLYRVDRTYASVDIVTYLGSIAGLCLGCSILTVVEISFYLTKLIYLAILHYGGTLDAVWSQRDKTKYAFYFKRR